MKDIVTKEQLRWCIKIQKCKYCPKLKECQFKKDKDKLIKKSFIHIDLGGYYGKRSSKASTNKD